MEGEAVTEALIESLATLEGDLKLGVIDTLGLRCEPVAVARLARLLNEADAVAAAATALGHIGTREAASELTAALRLERNPQRREPLASALLLAGQRLASAGDTPAAIGLFDHLRNAEVSRPCRLGATLHAILARGSEGVGLMVEQLRSSDPDFFQIGLAVSRTLEGERVTGAVTEALRTEPSAERQVLLILALRDRGDRAALSAILDTLKSDSPAVRLAAIDATGTLGDDSSAPILLSTADATTADAVLDALVAFKGSGVNAALIKAAEPPDSSPFAVAALG